MGLPPGAPGRGGEGSTEPPHRLHRAPGGCRGSPCPVSRVTPPCSPCCRQPDRLLLPKNHLERTNPKPVGVRSHQRLKLREELGAWQLSVRREQHISVPLLWQGHPQLRQSEIVRAGPHHKSQTDEQLHVRNRL